MPNPVPLSHISYHDSTGYATHVLIEVSQYINRKIQVASFSLPVVHGDAVLWDSGLAGVFRFEIQPVVGRTPSDRTPITAPATFRSDGGLFVESAVVVTCGNLICTTDVLVAQTVPATIHRVEPLARLEQLGGAHIFEAGFGVFQYRDHDDGDAAVVHLRIWGMSAGEEGPWDETLRVIDGLAEPLVTSYEDVTRLDFQPYTSSSQDPGTEYGFPVTRRATPGFFLTAVIGRTTPGVSYPRNSATKTQIQPLPIPTQGPSGPGVVDVSEGGDDVIHPRPRPDPQPAEARGGDLDADRTTTKR